MYTDVIQLNPSTDKEPTRFDPSKNIIPITFIAKVNKEETWIIPTGGTDSELLKFYEQWGAWPKILVDDVTYTVEYDVETGFLYIVDADGNRLLFTRTARYSFNAFNPLLPNAATGYPKAFSVLAPVDKWDLTVWTASGNTAVYSNQVLANGQLVELQTVAMRAGQISYDQQLEVTLYF